MNLFAMKTTKATFTPIDAESGETVDYSDVINEITLTPSAGSTQMAVSGANYGGQASWSVNLGLFQDIEKEGLLRFLLENEGKKYTALFEFVKGKDPLEAVVTISPASIGGAASNDIATSTVTLPIDGKPVFKEASAD